MRFYQNLLSRKDSPLLRLLSDDAGATAIEYGLIAALIAVAAIAAFQLVGTNLSDTFHGIATQL
jgi:pilus assembly protein Flp/PilA